MSDQPLPDALSAEAQQAERLLKIGDAAFYLSVDVKTVRRWIRKGAISTVTLPGGHKRIRLRDLELGESVVDKPPLKSGVYVIHAEQLSLVKIGSSSNLKSRIAGLRAGMPFSFTVVGFIHATNQLSLEAELHAKFSSFRVKGDWFTADPSMMAEMGQIIHAANSGHS